MLKEDFFGRNTEALIPVEVCKRLDLRQPKVIQRSSWNNQESGSEDFDEITIYGL